MSSKKQDISYIESLANEVLAKYRRLDSVLSHAPSKGSYHEKILRDMIRDYLPSTFSTGSGFIINKDSKVSSQMDILVVDNLDPRSYGYKDHDFFIATDIAVACFGEVKTYCTRNDFIESFHKLVNSSQVLQGTNSARTSSFLFCYDARASKETFTTWTDIAIEKLPNRDTTNSWNYPDYIFCLKKNVMLERKPVDGGFQYWHLMDKKTSSTIMQPLIMQNLFQCVTDGCGRIRMLQGIKKLD